MHGRSRTTGDPRIPTMLTRNTSGFHRPGTLCGSEQRVIGSRHGGGGRGKGGRGGRGGAGVDWKLMGEGQVQLEVRSEKWARWIISTAQRANMVNQGRKRRRQRQAAASGGEGARREGGSDSGGKIRRIGGCPTGRQGTRWSVGKRYGNCCQYHIRAPQNRNGTP